MAELCRLHLPAARYFNSEDHLTGTSYQLTHLYSIKDANKAFSYFIKKLRRIYNKSFPYKVITVKPHKSPWLTKSLLRLIKIKNDLYLKAKVNTELLDEYKRYKNRLCKIIRAAKYNYHKNVLSNLRNNSAKLWAHLNSIIKPSTACNIPLSPDALNDYFTSVFLQAPSPVANQKLTLPNDAFVRDSMVLSPITLDELQHAVSSLSNSSSIGADGMNPIAVKNNFDLLSNQLLYIYNLSFEQGIFPDLLKAAVVTPIFKSGSHNEPNSYRPISILTMFSKLLEKLFYKRLISFVDRHSLLNNFQFGFRENKSTSLAHAHVISSLLDKYKKGTKTVFALLDLRKAFDLINHEILLHKLSSLGIRGPSFKWISNYLTNRSQKTKVNCGLSVSKPALAGVPQGSILGPLLFIIFINDVFQLGCKGVELYLYADDTAVIFSADTSATLQCIIDDFFNKYSTWCTANCILVNPTKSNYLMFNVTGITVTINGDNLESVKSAKYLGVYIDDTLNWQTHVAYITKLCSQRIGLFKKVLPYFSNDVALLYYNAFYKVSFLLLLNVLDK